jgi:predicted TIM-barrel fold metal-dependent hydrolase
MDSKIERRRFLSLLAAGTAGLAWPGCSSEPEPGRYTPADVEVLAQQRRDEAAIAGRGRFGTHRYRGYRGLAELPWFELDPDGRLRCVADDLPPAIDFHCHLGMSVLLAPKIDLQASSPRVIHHLACDAEEPGCELDLDVYINGNFDADALRRLRSETIAQGLWGSPAAATQTIPNLLREMDDTRVGEAVILPIALGLPFGDDLAAQWATGIAAAEAGERLHLGASVHPRDPDRIASLERQVAAGARVVKLHPTVQRFYPDDPDMMELYAACDRLGLIVFFHGGRAGIEPESSHRYAMPRHYEAPLAEFPKLRFVLGHGGARDSAGMLEMGLRHDNAWFGIHGQGITRLDEMIRLAGGDRLLFGTDWPWYHLGATLAKVLIVTEGEPELRTSILRGNAERLLG